MKGPEAKLEAKFKKALKAVGCKSYKFSSPSNNGVTDQLVLIPEGIIVFAEIKNGNAPLSPLQVIFQRETLKSGHNHEVIRFEIDIENFILKYCWHLL